MRSPRCFRIHASRDVCSLSPMASTITSAPARHLHRLGDLPAVLVGIAGNHVVLVPRTADGDLAPLGVAHRHAPARRASLDALEHRHVVLAARRCSRRAAARCALGPITAIERSRAGSSGSTFALVLQQRDGLPGGLQGERAVRLAADQPLGRLRIDVRVVEQPHPELPAAASGATSSSSSDFLQRALAHQVRRGGGSSRARAARCSRRPARPARRPPSCRAATWWPCVSGRSLSSQMA